MGQVVAAGLLAGLDQDHAARMRDVLVLQRCDGSERAEHGIAVVGAAAAVELVALDQRHPGAEALEPAGHLRLLVEMAVEQHRLLAGAARRHLDQDHRRPSLEPDDLQRGAGKAGNLLAGIALEHADGVLHVAMGLPGRVERRRLVGDPDVVDQRRHDLVVPGSLDECPKARRVHVVESSL